jgi:hypothetical protein
MKRLSSNQNGIGLLAVLVLVAVVGIIGAVGYRVTSGSSTPTASVTANTSSKTPAKIKSTADVDTATKELDATDVNSSVDTGELDADISSLL